MKYKQLYVQVICQLCENRVAADLASVSCKNRSWRKFPLIKFQSLAFKLQKLNSDKCVFKDKYTPEYKRVHEWSNPLK